MTRVSRALGPSAWIVMMIAVGIEFALGVVCLALIPIRRPDQWLPPQNTALYSAHAVLGGVLALAAVVIVMTHSSNQRFVRLGVEAGLTGLALAAVGGMFSVWHPWRLTGLGLMFVGFALSPALFGYLIPLAEPEADTPTAEDARNPQDSPVEW